VHDNLHKVVPRPPLLVVQVHGERVSPKGCEFKLPSVRTLYTCGSVAGRSRVRGSVRYITHNSCAISVVPPFNKSFLFILFILSSMHILLLYFIHFLYYMSTIITMNFNNFFIK